MLMHPYQNNLDYLNGYQGMEFVDFANEAEKAQHESAVEALSEQFPEKQGLVRALYRQKLEEFMPEATIRTFVSIFVTREVKGALNRLQSQLH
ncbi:MAG: three-helix bundle dimerization domain-containing protein [Trichloromonadaceae bacterium]